MTVPSHAIAARTTFTACLANGKDMPDPQPKFASTPHDRVLTMQRTVFEGWQVDHKGEYKKMPGRYIVDMDGRTLIRIPEGRGPGQQPTVLTDVFANMPGVKLQPVGQTFGIAAVSDDGRVLTVGTRRTGGSWVYKSCWTSVIAQPRARAWL
jgi:hypothetical protein